jgi:hypothetical protein
MQRTILKVLANFRAKRRFGVDSLLLWGIAGTTN